MFGYVKPLNGELLVRQSEYYRAAYCGLCRSMRKRMGFFTSFSLSYDFAFLTVVRTAVTGETPEIEARRCPAHPMRKRPSFKENKTTDFCAAAAVILTYRKLLDDIADEKGWRRLRARLIKPVFARGRKKALRLFADSELSSLDECLARLLSELAEVERKNGNSADIPAEIFGKMLGEICAFGLDGNDRLLSYNYGRAIGHWIYLVDAADDFAEDAEKGRYNPLITLYGSALTEADRNWLENALIAKLMDAEAALDLMDIDQSPDAAGIIRNIMYLGLPLVAKQVLAGEYNRKKKSDSKKKTERKG